MYEKYYGFSAKPFQLVPNPAFFYLSPKHENALTYLEYGLKEWAGFILLTGEVGTGKTTLIRHMLNAIESEIETAVIFNTHATPEQLVGMILSEFEVDVPAGLDKSRSLEALNRFLIERYARNKRTLLIIDEAQNLSHAALEEVRMLSNLQTDEQMLLQIMLIGQPELRARLKGPDLAQLNQRIAVSYHLSALTREETAAYIAFRLEKVGGKPDLFTPEALDLIYKTSLGTPRTINLLCDAALVYGYADEQERIDVPVIEQVILDRDGVGFMQAPSTAAGAGEVFVPSAADIPAENRLDRLEKALQALQTQVNWQIQEIEGRAQGYKDDLVRKLKDLYDQERERGDRLMLECAQLKERSAALETRRGPAAPIDAPTIPPEELKLTRELLEDERRKNQTLHESYRKLKEEYLALQQIQVEKQQDQEYVEFINDAFGKKKDGKKRRF